MGGSVFGNRGMFYGHVVSDPGSGAVKFNIGNRMKQAGSRDRHHHQTEPSTCGVQRRRELNPQ
jgi:hypothetical protein